MQINDLFRQLSFGELSNLALANEGNGEIRESAHAQIISHCNEALLRIYTRFLLKENEVIIETVPHITNYYLLRKYAKSQRNTEKGPFYITDLDDEVFAEDVIKILSVRNQFGEVLPLNEELDSNSLFTPQFNLIQFPNPDSTRTLSVVYQAKHRELNIGDMSDPVLSKIDLPETLQGALRAYIAYCVFSYMNTQEASQKAQEHLSMFDSLCSEIEERGFAGSNLSGNISKFDRRGWV